MTAFREEKQIFLKDIRDLHVFPFDAVKRTNCNSSENLVSQDASHVKSHPAELVHFILFIR